MDGYSCCIITNGKRPAHLERLMASIHAQRFPAYEIIIVGALPVGWKSDGYTFIASGGAAAGRLGLLRNTAADAARYDHLIVLDDDLRLHADFYSGLLAFGEDYDLLSCRILNPDGTRFWDWKAHHGHDWLLDYGETSPYVSLTGGFVVMKRDAFELVRWSDTLGFYQAEDVDFSERARRAGLRIAFNPRSTVTHDGPYTQRGKGVYRIG
jgi:GT2 family glycosyltransferase